MDEVASNGRSPSAKLPRTDWLPMTSTSGSPAIVDAARRICSSCSRVTPHAPDASDCGNGAEQKRKDEQSQKDKEQDEAKAKEAVRKAKEQAKAKIKAERLELEMVFYELAAAEFYASHRVGLARQLIADAKGDEKLVQKSRERLFEVIKFYPDTQAASDANQILDGKFVPDRPFPPKPAIPKGITAEETEDVLTKRSQRQCCHRTQHYRRFRFLESARSRSMCEAIPLQTGYSFRHTTE